MELNHLKFDNVGPGGWVWTSFKWELNKDSERVTCITAPIICIEN